MKSRSKSSITLKLRYSTDENNIWNIRNIQKCFNSILRFTYNRICENNKYSTMELTSLQSRLNNVDECKSHLKNSAIYKSRKLHAINKNFNHQKVIFGGRKNFVDRCHHKITKNEFTKNRMFPIYSVGQCNCHGNRLFKIVDIHTIVFKPDRKHHIQLNLKNVGKNREERQ